MEGEEEFDGSVVVGQKPTVMVPRHIKKRSLKNKSLSINFDEKNLRVLKIWQVLQLSALCAAHSKRRKEAQKQLQEKERKIRIMARRKRKEERELALYGGLKDHGLDQEQDEGRDGEEGENHTSVSETKTYESGNATITVTTSQIVNDNEDLELAHTIPNLSGKLENNHRLLPKTKSMKGPAKQKLQKKGTKSPSHRTIKENDD
ncbi:hypothetical protein AXF42_Ash004483 [Apostasia shenzhenica]|uniref:Nucleolar protein 12 n=1 Tax=Apostasia shenzhenica TaxID=1088818 RepID=A0A2I0BGT7_9ASPA|nr:hypothetical protein AXF42_Ash004483 [Apostasia shenzhenica]